MPWYALSTLDDARRATTSLLLPLDPGRWLRLALIAFFVGGVGGGSSGGGQGSVNLSSSDFPTGTPGEFPPIDLPSVQSLVPLVAAALVSLFVIALAYLAIGSVMEFVFVEGATTRTVRIRRPFRQYARLGLRLFAFRVLLGLLVFTVVAVPIAATILGGLTLSPALFLLVIPVLVLLGLLALVVGVVLQLTTDFVVPTMLAEERGVFDAWRRVLPLLRTEWEQAALYVLVRYVLAIGAAIAVGLVVILLALVVALPFVVVGGGLYFVFVSMGGPGLVGWVVLSLVGALYGLAVVLVSLLVQVPVVTYFRYYALLVLGEFDVSLDLVPSMHSVGE